MADEPIIILKDGALRGGTLTISLTFKYDRPLKIEEDIKPRKADFFYRDVLRTQATLGLQPMTFCMAAGCDTVMVRFRTS